MFLETNEQCNEYHSSMKAAKVTTNDTHLYKIAIQLQFCYLVALYRQLTLHNIRYYSSADKHYRETDKQSCSATIEWRDFMNRTKERGRGEKKPVGFDCVQGSMCYKCAPTPQACTQTREQAHACASKHVQTQTPRQRGNRLTLSILPRCEVLLKQLVNITINVLFCLENSRVFFVTWQQLELRENKCNREQILNDCQHEIKKQFDNK